MPSRRGLTGAGKGVGWCGPELRLTRARWPGWQGWRCCPRVSASLVRCLRLWRDSSKRRHFWRLWVIRCGRRPKNQPAECSGRLVRLPGAAPRAGAGAAGASWELEAWGPERAGAGRDPGTPVPAPRCRFAALSGEVAALRVAPIVSAAADGLAVVCSGSKRLGGWRGIFYKR